MDGERRCGGSEFQTTGTATRKARSAKLGCSGSWNEQITSHSQTETRTATDISHCHSQLRNLRQSHQNIMPPFFFTFETPQSLFQLIGLGLRSGIGLGLAVGGRILSDAPLSDWELCPPLRRALNWRAKRTRESGGEDAQRRVEASALFSDHPRLLLRCCCCCCCYGCGAREAAIAARVPWRQAFRTAANSDHLAYYYRSSPLAVD